MIKLKLPHDASTYYCMLKQAPAMTSTPITPESVDAHMVHIAEGFEKHIGDGKFCYHKWQETGKEYWFVKIWLEFDDESEAIAYKLKDYPFD